MNSEAIDTSAAGGQRVEHRVVAGRCQQGLHRTADGHRRGEFPGIAATFHFWNQHRTDRGGVRHRGAGDRAEKGRGHDVDQRQAATHETDQHSGERHQASGHAALGHDRAGQHEERDGQQGEFVHAPGDLNHQGLERDVDPPRADQCGKAQGVGDRHADQDQCDKTAEQYQSVH